MHQFFQKHDCVIQNLVRVPFPTLAKKQFLYVTILLIQYTYNSQKHLQKLIHFLKIKNDKNKDSNKGNKLKIKSNFTKTKKANKKNKEIPIKYTFFKTKSLILQKFFSKIEQFSFELQLSQYTYSRFIKSTLKIIKMHEQLVVLG